MALHMNQEQAVKLAKLGADANYVYIESKCYCTLTDTATKKPLIQRQGQNEHQALRACLAEVGEVPKPLSQAEAVMQTQTQAERIAELESELAKLQDAKKERSRSTRSKTTETKASSPKSKGTPE
jgi:RIO-like serine/threonine protein kinase